MEAFEPQVRHRGFFLHSDTGEPEVAEHEAPEGLVVRTRMSRRHVPRRASGISVHSGRSRTSIPQPDENGPAIRSGSVTGSRQRAHLPR